MSNKRELKNLLGSRIAKLRKNKGLSQEKFAEIVNISQRALSSIETGVNYAKPETVEKIAKGLELSTSELFNFNDEFTKKELIELIFEKVNFVQNDINKLRIIYDFLKKVF